MPEQTVTAGPAHGDSQGSESTGPEPRLYVILGSHACRTGMLMMEHKGIRYRRVDLVAGLHPMGVRLLGFPGYREPTRRLGERSSRQLAILDRMGTVPALRVGDDRVQTNREIARYLDRLKPEPPLFPADPEQRREVEEAERWGDDVFQMTARRLALAAVLHGPDGLDRRANDGRLGPLLWRNERLRFIGTRAIGRFVFGANVDSEREMMASLPAQLDRIDAWIDAGVLNGEALNAADFMIAPSAALLCYRLDVKPEIEARPVGRLVDRVLPAVAD
jgi:glutathione S-transferase